ncbi:aldehyde oxidase GLOX [Salvia miltiorrhiza]|uniref:aldehyde oxidase GLOX n=1 Tax=Salvia miltiorrhiza TaxID=226208 RepID=UPI0025AD12A9|nr:aldehyde oxidase GLOX [Salvia miltiorrhiza]
MWYVIVLSFFKLATSPSTLPLTQIHCNSLLQSREEENLVSTLPTFSLHPLMTNLLLLLLLVFVARAAADLPGAWELLVADAGIASMHTAVTRFNTVVLLDRTHIGPSRKFLPENRCLPNPVHPHRKDCTAHSVVLDLKTNALRPLTILTDTWCSSGQFLPDGSLIQTGGDLDGFRKIRRFTPCEPGSFCDWEELQDAQLYRGRWYATNQILPEGSVIIIGGKAASSVEYFPPRKGAVDFSFLSQVEDNQMDNLYPYVHLLPNGELFIFANNKAVSYDYNSNKVTRNYPVLKGGPRNYPSAGSSAMLALSGDYSSATVVICGGAEYGAYLERTKDTPAHGSCGRIEATRPGSAWEMEDMPFGRIMGDMVMLPSGDVLIINGAQAGTQGFELASDPCLFPVLYRPDQPVGLLKITICISLTSHINGVSKPPAIDDPSYTRWEQRDNCVFNWVINNIETGLVNELDVTNAFLHGELDDNAEIYMEVPPGYSEEFDAGQVCRLKKTLYGLKQSPRVWFGRFCLAMAKNGYKQRDDVEEIVNLKKNLFLEFEMKDLKISIPRKYFRDPRFDFLAVVDWRAVVVGCETGLLECKPAETPIVINHGLTIVEGADLTDQGKYQRLVGKLIYLSHTRPDITYAVGIVSQFMHKPQKEHMEAALRIVRYLKGTTDYGILLEKKEDLEVDGFTDADWASNPNDRKSTAGYFTFVGGNLVTWRSKKQKVVALSSAEAEFRGVKSGITEILWLRRLLTEIGFPPRRGSRLFCDNKAAISISENPVQHDRTKHVEIDRHFIKEKLDSGIIELPFIRSDEQLADILTKAVNTKVFREVLDKLNGLRFMTLKAGTVPRMYHSTANLLPDGRVLVAGSNPHYFYNFKAEFPTELRIEAFSPEYLAADKANIRPSLVELPAKVGYGEVFEAAVTVELPVVGIMEVNLASAPFATHSFSQGQRLVKLSVETPAVGDGGRYRIKCRAPPNAKVAPPGYYMVFVMNLGVPSVAQWIQLVACIP